MKESRVTAVGVNGQLELNGDNLTIKRKGFVALMTQGFKGDKDIQISSITSIQFKSATLLTRGYIQFSFMGGQEAKGGILEAVQDENSVLFGQSQQPAFERIKAAIESRRSKPVGGVSESKAFRVDALERLANLYSKGLLTEAEFASEKRKLLGD